MDHGGTGLLLFGKLLVSTRMGAVQLVIPVQPLAKQLTEEQGCTNPYLGLGLSIQTLGACPGTGMQN